MRPSSVRHRILIATTLVAFLMYLDRTCLAWVLSSGSFNAEMPLSEEGKRQLTSAFFWAYALAQVPAGWLAERFGKRVLMTFLIGLWSLFTALGGCSQSLTLLMLARLGCGLAEAGAYPISGSLLARWSHTDWRGFTSSVVSLGGRLGFCAAPIITSTVILGLNGFGGHAGWRWASWTYGLLGMGVAWIFWVCYRETPAFHPGVNEAELALLEEGRASQFSDTSQAPRPARFPWRAVLTDRSVWCMCAFQLLTNYGWAFSINSMSSYLKTVRHLTDAQNGRISSTALALGLGGLLVGGLVTDACTRRMGRRLGRLLPMTITRFLCAGLFLACLGIENPWIFAVCLGAMTFSADSSLPAQWAWAQDVGGRHVAPLFGWANMWGNFGAALQPMVNGWVLATFDTGHDWRPSFVACAVAFSLAGVFALGIDAGKAVERSI